MEVDNDFEVKRRTVLTTVPEAMRTLKGLKIPTYCNLELIRSFEELQNYVLTDELILLLTEHDFDESYYSGILTLPENVLENPWVNIIPEKIMFFFIKNLQSLKKAIDLSRTINLTADFMGIFPTLLDKTLSTNLQILESTLKKITNEGFIKDDVDPELKRLNYIINSFETES